METQTQKNLAFYSSNGRIRHIIVLDRSSLNSSSEEEILNEIPVYFTEFVDTINYLRPAEAQITVSFFYLAMHPETMVASPVKDPKRQAYYIPVKDGISNMWTQDEMHVVEENDSVKLIVSGNVDGDLRPKLKAYLSPNIQVEQTSFYNKLPDGGDYMRIKGERGDYAVDGATIGMKSGSAAAPHLGIDPKFYFTLEWLNMHSSSSTILTTKFFHLDLYLTFAGLDKDQKTNLILLPNFIYHESAPESLKFIENKIFEFPSQLMELGLEENYSVIYIPLIHLGSGNILSYNNCVVENYEDKTGKRQITIFFPDYGTKIKEVANESRLIDSNKENKSIPDKKEFINNIMIAYTYFSGTNSFTTEELNHLSNSELAVILDNLITSAENKIEADLTKWGITVRFVDLNCDYTSDRQGSLHCRVKVIERDCLP